MYKLSFLIKRNNFEVKYSQKTWNSIENKNVIYLKMGWIGLSEFCKNNSSIAGWALNCISSDIIFSRKIGMIFAGEVIT